MSQFYFFSNEHTTFGHSELHGKCFSQSSCKRVLDRQENRFGTEPSMSTSRHSDIPTQWPYTPFFETSYEVHRVVVKLHCRAEPYGRRILYNDDWPLNSRKLDGRIGRRVVTQLPSKVYIRHHRARPICVCVQTTAILLVYALWTKIMEHEHNQHHKNDLANQPIFRTPHNRAICFILYM